MKPSTATIALTIALAVPAVPALALPAQVPGNAGTQRAPDNPGSSAGKPTDPGSQVGSEASASPGPGASASSKAKAYGKYCADQSRKRVAGQKGTPFSLCVTAMAKLATGQTNNPTTACKTESKKRVAGQKGTPFSKCVSAGAKLLGDQQDEEEAPHAS